MRADRLHARWVRPHMKYDLIRYADGTVLGIATLTDAQMLHYLAISQQPEGIIRLSELPREYYTLSVDTEPHCSVYIA